MESTKNVAWWVVASIVVVTLVVAVIAVRARSSDPRFEALTLGPASTPTAAPCESAFVDAAAVPAADVADEPLLRTARDCASVAEWQSAFGQYPKAFGLAEYPSSVDLPYYFTAVCDGQRHTKLCQEADTRGLLAL